MRLLPQATRLLNRVDAVAVGQKRCRLIRKALRSFVITIYGCATLVPAKRRNSPPTALKILATPPTTQAGYILTAQFFSGRPTQKRLRPFSRTNARLAKCIR